MAIKTNRPYTVIRVSFEFRNIRNLKLTGVVSTINKSFLIDDTI